jgi:sec-independent protein translocase protein TatA
MYMGQTEWMIVGGIALVLFGGSKIPQLAKGLGEGIREFKKSIEGMGEEEKPKPAAPKSAE